MVKKGNRYCSPKKGDVWLANVGGAQKFQAISSFTNWKENIFFELHKLGQVVTRAVII